MGGGGEAGCWDEDKMHGWSKNECCGSDGCLTSLFKKTLKRGQTFNAPRRRWVSFSAMSVCTQFQCSWMVVDNCNSFIFGEFSVENIERLRQVLITCAYR